MLVFGDRGGRNSKRSRTVGGENRSAFEVDCVSDGEFVFFRFTVEDQVIEEETGLIIEECVRVNLPQKETFPELFHAPLELNCWHHQNDTRIDIHQCIVDKEPPI